jgi:hypothetical protein
MRYVIVDPEGSSRAHFASLREVDAWARAVAAEDPDLYDELQLLTYDAAGSPIANQWLSAFASGGSWNAFALVSDRESLLGGPMMLLGPASQSPVRLSAWLSEGWSHGRRCDARRLNLTQEGLDVQTEEGHSLL